MPTLDERRGTQITASGGEVIAHARPKPRSDLTRTQWDATLTHTGAKMWDQNGMYARDPFKEFANEHGTAVHVFYQGRSIATIYPDADRWTPVGPGRGASEMRAVDRRGVPVDDPEYTVQALWPDGRLASSEFGFDDEATTIREAKDLLRSMDHSDAYVRVITRDGELVWDSRDPESLGSWRAKYPDAREMGEARPSHRSGSRLPPIEPYVGATVEFRGTQGTSYGHIIRFEGGYAMVRWSGGAISGVTPSKLRVVPHGWAGPGMREEGWAPGGARIMMARGEAGPAMKAEPIASVEIRHGGWSYRAEMYDEWVGNYSGATRRTEYFRFNKEWKPVAWSAIPKPAYRRLRDALKIDLARGEMHESSERLTPEALGGPPGPGRGEPDRDTLVGKWVVVGEVAPGIDFGKVIEDNRGTNGTIVVEWQWNRDTTTMKTSIKMVFFSSREQAEAEANARVQTMSPGPSYSNRFVSETNPPEHRRRRALGGPPGPGRGTPHRNPDAGSLATELSKAVGGTTPKEAIHFNRDHEGYQFTTSSPEYNQKVVVVLSNEKGGNVALSIYADEARRNEYESINSFLFGPDGYTSRSLSVAAMKETIEDVWKMVDDYAASWDESEGGDMEEAPKKKKKAKPKKKKK